MQYSYAQDQSDALKRFYAKKINTFNPSELTPTYDPTITHLEAPAPGGDSYRSALLRMKKDMSLENEKFNLQTSPLDESLDPPLTLNGYTMSKRLVGNRDTIELAGGTPLDNTLAISNDNYLMAGINTLIYCQKVENGDVSDSIQTWSFANFAGDIPTDRPFDPKIIYDPDYNRFVATYLTGRGPLSSGLIIAFSLTDDPFGEWAVYLIPGNPLDDNSWSDYPAISFTKEEVFYTVNLLIPSTNWKTAFKRTLIWQIRKTDGYNGSDSLTMNLWSEIAHNGRYLRNLAVVHGGDSIQGPNAYFISNRNFDALNDTTFLVEIPNTIENSKPEDLKVTALKAVDANGNPAPYGLPPNGTQANSNPGSSEEGFDTNDARVLGAFKVGNSIQFVGNSVDPGSSNPIRAAVYHGFIDNLDSSPTLSANIIAYDSLDLGYPNIVFTGNDTCTTSSLISFNHTSKVHFAGTSVVRYSRGKYSKLKYLKEGLNYVDMHDDAYERWGDYYGLQTKYNEPGVVWAAGFYGNESQRSRTWLAELRDCDCFDYSVTKEELSFNKCDGKLVVDVKNGVPPYTYVLGNDTMNDPDSLLVDLCDLSEDVVVMDSKGCGNADRVEGDIQLPQQSGTLYPNPVNTEEVSVYFSMPYDGPIDVNIYASDGKLAEKIVSGQTAYAGDNLLRFSTRPLQGGMYILIITSSNNEIYQEKFIVP